MTGEPSADLGRAWARHLIDRERTTFVIACALVFCLVPAWSAFDHWLEPAHARHFLYIRLAVTAGAIAAFVILRRSRRSGLNRALMAGVALSTGIMIAYFVSRIDAHYHLYTIGFSLIFWGFGPLLLWPPAYTAGVYVVLLGVHAALRLHHAGAEDLTTFLGLFAYLASAAVITTGVSVSRRRLERGAFVASYQLAERNAELALALATIEKTQARIIGAEKLAALGRLVAQLSHEINNPLNVIQNNLAPIGNYLSDIDAVLDAARKSCPDPDADVSRVWRARDLDFVRTDLHDAVSMVAAATGRIRAIQQDLRAFMRGDVLAAEVGDPNEAIRSTVALFRRNLPPGVALEEDYGVLRGVRFHSGQIGQVVLNLLQNALDAVGERGEIRVQTRLEADSVALTVTDSGPGISEAIRPKLFEPFFTTKEIGKGTGLGLAVCHQIMRAHRGAIFLDETYRTGARFVLRFPLPPAPAAGEQG